MGRGSKSRWHSLRCRVYRPESRRGMAGQPPHLRGESEYCKCLQHRQFCSFHRQHLFRCSAGKLSLQHRELVQIPITAFAGDPQKFGQPDDPLVGKPIGGVIVFGGGLALYDKNGKIVGALGVSGDTSCADHVVAWKTRQALGLNAVPMGVAPGPSDNLIFDIQNGVSSSGFGHPACKGGNPSEEIINKLNQDPSCRSSPIDTSTLGSHAVEISSHDEWRHVGCNLAKPTQLTCR